MIQTKTAPTTKSTHTRPEVHECPRMVRKGVVGCYGPDGHKKKVCERPNGQGTQYVVTHVNGGFLRKQNEGN